jgi:hypothetical protein
MELQSQLEVTVLFVGRKPSARTAGVQNSVGDTPAGVRLADDLPTGEITAVEDVYPTWFGRSDERDLKQKWNQQERIQAYQCVSPVSL